MKKTSPISSPGNHSASDEIVSPPVGYTSIAEALAVGNVFAGQCPSRLILNHITSRWGVLVLVALLAGTHRFSELRRKINGVSERMLAQTLQTLESDGFVARYSLPVVPPHVEYNLTPLGVEVAEQVRNLVDWIEQNLGRIHLPLDGNCAVIDTDM